MYSDTGLYLFYVDNTTLSNNHIVNNNFGVYFQHSESNDFHNNSMETNSDYGLVLDADSQFNTIHHNAFLNNGGSSSQAKDDGSNNVWYEDATSEGNYWYNGTIAITPYPIDGLASSVDLYPLGSIPVISEILKENAILQLLLFISSVSVLFVFFQRKKKQL